VTDIVKVFDVSETEFEVHPTKISDKHI